MGEMLLSMDNLENFNFNKVERITGESRIDNLFIKGISFVAYPLRVVYLISSSCSPVRVSVSCAQVPVSVLISVPKKRIKSAVERNKIKRLIRESYRLNKHILTEINGEKDNRQIDIAFVYVKDELMGYLSIEKGMHKALTELKNRLIVNS